MLNLSKITNNFSNIRYIGLYNLIFRFIIIAGQAAMADNRPLVKKLAIYAENVKEIDLHNVKIEGYEGERLHFANVGHFGGGLIP